MCVCVFLKVCMKIIAYKCQHTELQFSLEVLTPRLYHFSSEIPCDQIDIIGYYLFLNSITFKFSHQEMI